MTSVVQTKHPRRNRSLRIFGFDYSKAGAYFVTICTVQKQCIFGNIVASQMQLNLYGQVIEKAWLWLAEQYPYVELDEWVIMPNHLHGIIWIADEAGGSRAAPTDKLLKYKPLGQLIGAFKTVSSKELRSIDPIAFEHGIWQRSFYDRVIRDYRDLRRIREYIVANPENWDRDRDNLDREH